MGSLSFSRENMNIPIEGVIGVTLVLLLASVTLTEESSEVLIIRGER